MGVACKVFGHRQVFTAEFRMRNVFLSDCSLDFFIFVLRKTGKGFITDIHSDFLKKVYASFFHNCNGLLLFP